VQDSFPVSLLNTLYACGRVIKEHLFGNTCNNETCARFLLTKNIYIYSYYNLMISGRNKIACDIAVIALLFDSFWISIMLEIVFLRIFKIDEPSGIR
jgi:hypothetical protein